MHPFSSKQIINKGASFLKMKRRYSKISLIGLLVAMTLIFLSTAPAQQKEPEVPYVSTPDEVVAEI